MFRWVEEIFGGGLSQVVVDQGSFDQMATAFEAQVRRVAARPSFVSLAELSASATACFHRIHSDVFLNYHGIPWQAVERIKSCISETKIMFEQAGNRNGRIRDMIPNLDNKITALSIMLDDNLNREAKLERVTAMNWQGAETTPSAMSR